MAEKKVSSRNKNSISPEQKQLRAEKDAVYNDFVAKFGPELRKRTTRTVAQPPKKTVLEKPETAENARCGEINPHMTVNPAATHQIITKRTGRILADDTGFKAESYNDRFELTAEMPEIREEDNVTESELEQNGIPGQQTMADLFSADSDSENISVPVESQIIQESDNPFASAYEQLKKEGAPIGKSEKLRAIARTATDDAGMEPESQIAFPAFDPLFKFPEEGEKNQKEKKIKHKDKPKKEKVKKEKVKKEKQPKPQEAFDIEEKEIVTSREAVVEEEKKEEKDTAAQAKKALAERKEKFFEFLKDSGNTGETEAPFEMGSKNDIRDTNTKLALISKTALIKSAILLVLSFILFIISAVFDRNEDGALRAVPILYSGISLLFTFAAGGICIKEIIEGFKDIAKKKITLNTGGIIIIFASLLQNICAIFASGSFPGNVRLVSAAAIFSLIPVVLPKFFLSNNSRLTVGMFSGQNTVSVFKKAAESGIDGSLREKYSQDNRDIRYGERTDFATGLMTKLTNAVPKPFATNASYVFILAFALVVSIASGIICKSFITGITAFSATVITSVPVTYVLSAAILLYNTNNKLAKHKASLLSYRCAGELTNTGAIIFDAAELVEKSSCSIHGIKSFGRTDPRKATLYCASVVNAALSPLSSIMKQVTEQSGEDVPVAEDVNVETFKGISAKVENSSVILGSRDFLKENGVYIPDEDFEEKFITGDRKLLYLAVNGEFSMLLIVSYHIKRSVSAFLRYLETKNISFIVHSSDPNITPAFIAKKCKLKQDGIKAAESNEAAYLRDKESKTASAMPADVFSDGRLTSLSALIRSAFALKKIIDMLPLAVYAFSAMSALLITAPILLGSSFSISNIYIILIRAAGIGAAYALGVMQSKK